MAKRRFKLRLGQAGAFTFALALCMLSTCAPASSKSDRSDKASNSTRTEWILEQHHHQSGYNTFYFSDDAVKIYSKNFGFYFISKAPDWKVHAFRLDDKIMKTMSRKEYYDFQHYYKDRLPFNAVKPDGADVIFSMKCLKYKGAYHDDWVAQFKGVTAPVWDIISAHYKSQRVDGIVLKSVKNAISAPKKKLSTMWDDEVESGVRLQTLKLKEIPYRSQDFIVPSGCRVVADLRQIITSKDSRREAESIIEQMGLGERLGTDKKK